jgi:hypothetical protein
MFRPYVVVLPLLSVLLWPMAAVAGSYTMTATGDSVNCHEGGISPWNITVQEGEQVSLTFSNQESRPWQFTSPVWGGTVTVAGGSVGTVGFIAPGANFSFKGSYADGCVKAWGAVFVQPLPKSPAPQPPAASEPTEQQPSFSPPFTGGSNTSAVGSSQTGGQPAQNVIDPQSSYSDSLPAWVKGRANKPEADAADKPNKLLLFGIATGSIIITSVASILFVKIYAKGYKHNPNL